MKTVKATYLWLIVAILTIVWASFSAIGQILMLPFGKRAQQCWGHLAGRYWGRSTFWLMPMWSVSVTGQEKLPELDQPRVLVCNHQSAADIWAVYFLTCQFRWLSKKEVFKFPLVGHAMRWAGYISIDRGNRQSHTQAMEESEHHLRNGVSMFFFPEGTRSKTGQLKPFKSGAFRLAAKVGVPIQPIVLTGTKDLLLKGALVPGKAQVKIKVLDPVSFRDIDPEEKDLDRFTQAVQDLMSQALEQT